MFLEIYKEDLAETNFFFTVWEKINDENIVKMASRNTRTVP